MKVCSRKRVSGSLSDNQISKRGSINQNLKWIAVIVTGVVFAMWGGVAGAQQSKIYRIGAVHQGGPYAAVVEGLRDGLKESGLVEGKQFVLEIRDAEGDIKAVDEAGRTFERDKVNLIFAVTTSVVTAVKNVTSRVPIVFAVGSDPVASGLVQSFPIPGVRLTGVQYSTTDLTGKRLEILKEMLPKLSRIVIVYNPKNPIAVEAASLARKAGKQFGVQVAERHAKSVEELRQVFAAVKAKEADAYFYTSDAMVASQAEQIVSMATAKKLPTMFAEQNLVAMGGLASYGQNYHATGRLAAKYIQKIMTGAQPGDLRVEVVDRFELVFNLKTAKQIGVTIPVHLLARANRVIK